MYCCSNHGTELVPASRSTCVEAAGYPTCTFRLLCARNPSQLPGSSSLLHNRLRLSEPDLNIHNRTCFFLLIAHGRPFEELIPPRSRPGYAQGRPGVKNVRPAGRSPRGTCKPQSWLGGDCRAQRVCAAQGCRGPVHAVVAEHWALYTHWNAAERRHQVRPAAPHLRLPLPMSPSLSRPGGLTCDWWAAANIHIHILALPDCVQSGSDPLRRWQSGASRCNVDSLLLPRVHNTQLSSCLIALSPNLPSPAGAGKLQCATISQALRQNFLLSMAAAHAFRSLGPTLNLRACRCPPAQD